MRKTTNTTRTVQQEPSRSNQEKIDINVKEISYTKQNKFVSSQLVLELSGKDMNYIIANTLRRVSYDEIPTYAFEYVNIEHNNSKAFDNDAMRLRLRQLPVYDVDSGLYYLHPKYWKDIDYYDKNHERHEKEKNIEVNINYYNNTNELVSVTTKDILYTIDGQPVEYPNRNPDEPILLIELLPNQTFKCHMRAFLGTGERDSIWYGSKLTYYDYDDQDPNKITFTIESTGQLTEYNLLTKCCKLVKLKLDSIAEEIDRRVKSKEIKIAPIVFIELINEDHTMGNLINNALQDHPQILFSGLSKPDHLVKLIRLKIQCTDDIDSPMKPFFEVIKYLINVFDNLENQFTKLDKKLK